VKPDDARKFIETQQSKIKADVRNYTAQQIPTSEGARKALEKLEKKQKTNR
jgi:hypothetical protein